MKKQDSFFLMKFDSGRLKDCNYKVKTNFQESQKNGELIRLADNQVLRSLRKIKGINYSQEELIVLTKERKKIFSLPNSEENRIRVKELSKEIEKMLFVPEIVSVKFENKAHYVAIKNRGLFINGIKYTRLLAGSGNLRRNTVFYIDTRYKSRLNQVLDNGRDLEANLVPAKFSAYYGLYNSSSLEVEFPRFAVIPDCEIEKTFTLDWVSGSGRDIVVEEKEIPVKLNLFDGQGIISPNQMSVWAENMDLSYTPSWCIVRAPYLKGNLACFDFHRFAKENGKKYLADVWGNQILVDDVEILISTSQFKLWQSYKSLKDYLDNCKKNNLSFGITRYAPSEEKEKSHTYSNYQFTQVLDLSDEDIESFCGPTLKLVEDLSGFDYERMLLYLMGEGINQLDEHNWFDRLQDPVVKALLIEPGLKEDEYIRQRFSRGLNRFIREAYLGSTLHQGNFSAILSDPYAQCEWAFGMEPKGLLKEKQYYSNFWNKKGINKVAACRAPLTHYSEVNILNFKNDEKTRDWYKNITSGTVLPILGNDTMIFAD